MRRGSPAATWLAFVTAFVTLFVQVLVHRMISAKLLNNFAFLVISLTMLGFAFSGVVLSRALPRFLESLEDHLVACAALFGVSLLCTTLVFYRADVGLLLVHTRPDFVRAFLRCLPLALLYAVPFAFCGLMLGALLSAPRFPTSRVYFFDLMGSGLGAVTVIPAIAWVGVEPAAIAASGLLLAATVLLAPPRGRPARGLAVGVALALVLAFLARGSLFGMVYPAGSPLADAAARGQIERIVWDPVTRIELMRIAPPDPAVSNYPSFYGENRQFLSRFRRMITQNNAAPTYAIAYDGRRESLRGIEETIYSTAYHVTTVQSPRVLVVGVGGGYDILTALYFGCSQVTGVEVNGATVDIVTRLEADYFAPWVRDPRTHIVHAEGRGFLATNDQQYDIIQLSGVDSFTGTPGAAHVFSESYLYTVEAFQLYLSRLTSDGMLNMMRYEYKPPNEMLRALVTAVEALRRIGIDRPEDHIAMVSATNGHFAAMLVKRTPFTLQERERLHTWLVGNRLMEVAAAPDFEPERGNAYHGFLALRNAGLQARAVAAYPFDVSALDDDRPFFFHRSFWWHLFPAQPMVWAATPAMEYALILLLLIVGAATFVCVYLPLRWKRDAVGRPQRRWAVFFGGIGIGYMMLEIGLLQKFGLFLGHPNHALSIVLASLLVTTGFGSLASPWLLGRLGQLRFVSYFLAFVVLLEYYLVPRVLGPLVTLPFVARAAVVCALVTPIGLCLGTFLPSGLDRLKRWAPGLAPWGWGVNGVFSVLTPPVAVGVSMTFGITALLLTSVPIYLIASLALPSEEIAVAP